MPDTAAAKRTLTGPIVIGDPTAVNPAVQRNSCRRCGAGPALTAACIFMIDFLGSFLPSTICRGCGEFDALDVTLGPGYGWSFTLAGVPTGPSPDDGWGRFTIAGLLARGVRREGAGPAGVAHWICSASTDKLRGGFCQPTARTDRLSHLRVFWEPALAGVRRPCGRIPASADGRNLALRCYLLISPTTLIRSLSLT